MGSGSTVFIGGGNMAAAIVGGMVAAGRDPRQIVVVEPDASRREQLAAAHRVEVLAAASERLDGAELVVWAVKPQVFGAAAAPAARFAAGALQLSVMAGIRSDAIVAATGSERVVRAMPNTPALIGMGIAGLYARPGASASDRDAVSAVMATTGQLVWVDDEGLLDAVTALSGSGPAYVFHLVEAMLEAAHTMGLADADAKALAVQTIAGAAALAARSGEPPETLRRQVTSPGGTTEAAMAVLESRGVKAAVVAAIVAARDRARALGGGESKAAPSPGAREP